MGIGFENSATFVDCMDVNKDVPNNGYDVGDYVSENVGDEFENDSVPLVVNNVNNVECRKKEMFNKIMVSDVMLNEEEVRSIINEIFDSVDVELNIEAAIKDFGDTCVHEEYVKDFDNKLKDSDGDLERMISKLQSERSNERMSLERVVGVCSKENPDFQRLCKMANEGMPVIRNESLTMNNRKPKLRRLGLRVKGPINYLVNLLAEKKNAIVLSSKLVKEFNINLHFGATHWTLKKGKSEGRILLDLGNEEHAPPLNSKNAKELCKEYFGLIVLPTLNDIIS
jgi:hypothetical protein